MNAVGAKVPLEHETPYAGLCEFVLEHLRLTYTETLVCGCRRVEGVIGGWAIVQNFEKLFFCVFVKGVLNPLRSTLERILLPLGTVAHVTFATCSQHTAMRAILLKKFQL